MLVTGARGFIGRHCLAALAERTGLTVHAVTNSQVPCEQVYGSKLVWHRCNLHNAAATRQLVRKVRPEYLLHLAWIATPGVYWESPENETWLASSMQLIREFIGVGGRRIVMSGSCAEYDWNYGRCHEATTPSSRLTRYSDCKHRLREQAEVICEAAGVAMAWGRVFFAYGPGEPANKLIPSLISGLLGGQQVRCSTGLHRRDFIHAADVGEAFCALLLSNLQGLINLGTGRATSIKDVVHLLEEITGRRDLIQLGARPTLTQEPPLVVADTARLQNNLGFQPVYDLSTGLRRYVARWTQSIFGSHTGGQWAVG